MEGFYQKFQKHNLNSARKSKEEEHRVLSSSIASQSNHLPLQWHRSWICTQDEDFHYHRQYPPGIEILVVTCIMYLAYLANSLSFLIDSPIFQIKVLLSISCGWHCCTHKSKWHSIFFLCRSHLLRFFISGLIAEGSIEPR